MIYKGSFWKINWGVVRLKKLFQKGWAGKCYFQSQENDLREVASNRNTHTHTQHTHTITHTCIHKYICVYVNVHIYVYTYINNIWRKSEVIMKTWTKFKIMSSVARMWSNTNPHLYVESTLALDRPKVQCVHELHLSRGLLTCTLWKSATHIRR